jgi:hypothetical protein
VTISLVRVPAIPAAVALVAASVPSAAQQPGLNRGYGPLTVCIAGYAIDIHADEAAELTTDANGGALLVRVLGDNPIWFAGWAGEQPPGEQPVRVSTVFVEGFGRIERRVYAQHLTYRPGLPFEMVATTLPARTDYVLPLRPGQPQLIIQASRSGRLSEDRQVVRRFAPQGPATSCAIPPHAEGTPASHEIATWSPVRHAGPFYVCHGLLGYALRPGEYAQHAWRWNDRFTHYVWRIRGAEFEVEIAGERDPHHPQLAEKPTGNLLAMGYRLRQSYDRYHWALEPPPSYPRDFLNNGFINLTSYRSDTSALAAFVERLEYLRAGDRRCSSSARGRTG